MDDESERIPAEDPDDKAGHNRLGHRQADEDAPHDERGSQGPRPEEEIDEEIER